MGRRGRREAEQIVVTPKPQVLIIGQDARARGGVNNYLRLLRLRLRGRVDAARFMSGRRYRESGLARQLWRMLTDYLRFAVLIRRRRFDILHLNPSMDLASLPRDICYLFIAWALAPRMAVMIFYRGWNADAFARLMRRWSTRAVLALAHQRAGAILVLSQTFRQALMGAGVEPAKIVVTTTFFDGDQLALAVERTAKIPDEILFLSRFVPAKGGHLLIEAFAAVSPAFPAACLVMAGDGPQRAELEALTARLGVTDRVAFTGYLDHRFKMDALARAGLFVLPTTHPEGMPNAVLEAMAAGAVIIATPVGAIPEVVDEAASGLLLDPCNPQTLAAALTRYLSDPAATRAVGEANREKAWRLWEAGPVARLIEQDYRALLSPGRLPDAA